MIGNVNSPGMAAAAMAAMLLSACVGGGGAPGSGGGGASGGGGSSSFGQGTKGVSVAVSRASGASSPTFAFEKGGTAWTVSPSGQHALMGSGVNGWFGAAKTDAAGGSAQERIAAYSDIDAASGSTEDPDYLVFGYWNRIATGGNVNPVPFYWGPEPYKGDVTGGTNADVTYSGPAAGMYNVKSNLARGHFTASASLTANFGAGTLEGTVSGFMFQTVTTAPAPTSTATLTLSQIQLTGPSFLGAIGNDGTWSGSFFGPSSGGADPTGVAGVFDGEITTSAGVTTVTGGFGAKKQ